MYLPGPTQKNLFITNYIAMMVYGFLYVVNYYAINETSDKFCGNAVNMMINQVWLGLLLSAVSVVFLCVSSKFDNVSMMLFYLNVISVHIYVPFCILSLLRFVDFGYIAHHGCGACVVLVLEFGAITVMFALLHIYENISFVHWLAHWVENIPNGFVH
jgi:hypothetical protein